MSKTYTINKVKVKIGDVIIIDHISGYGHCIKYDFLRGTVAKITHKIKESPDPESRDILVTNIKNKEDSKCEIGYYYFFEGDSYDDSKIRVATNLHQILYGVEHE